MTNEAETQPTRQILELLTKVRADIGAIGKEGYNDSQKYNFRGIDAVLNHVGPALTKHGITPSVHTIRKHKLESYTENTKGGYTRLVHRATLKMVVRLYAPDGSFVENQGVGEGIDYGGDKATSKAMSVAYKYAVTLGLCMPVIAGDLMDSDNDARPADEATGLYRQGKPAGRRPAQGERGPDRRPASRGERRTDPRAGQAVQQPAANGSQPSQPAADNPGNHQAPASNGEPPANDAASRSATVGRAEAAIRDARTEARVEEVRGKLHDPRRPLSREDVERLERLCDTRIQEIKAARQ